MTRINIRPFQQGMYQRENRQLILEIIQESLDRLNPFNVVAGSLSYDSESDTFTVSGDDSPAGSGNDTQSASPDLYSLAPDRGLWILGGGKAATAMGLAVESVFGDRIRDGILITPKGTKKKLQHIQMMEGTHPLPGKNSLAATWELTELARKIPEGDLVICLISGGTSALMCLPAGDLEPAELAETYRLLLRSGADIHKMNVVRTALSRIKGGGLLSCLSHTSVIDLIISDVPGDDFRSIGSGPTTPVEKDYKQAFQILKTFGIWNNIPHEVRTFITKGMYNPEPDNRTFPKEHNQYLVSSAGRLAREVARQCRRHGFEPDVAESSYNIPISELEAKIVDEIHSGSGRRGGGLQNGSGMKNGAGKRNSTDKNASHDAAGPASDRASTISSNGGKHQAVILYGESSVTVTGDGKGGRNQELALRVAEHLTPEDHVTFASIGTDGVDGPTDAAGAIVDGFTHLDAEKLGLDPKTYLTNNDSYHFFKQAGGLIRTGPTGNNLMDLQILLFDSDNP